MPIRSPAPEVEAVVAELKRLSKKSVRDGMARYGIPNDNALGVPVGTMQKLAKRLGRSHELAAGLWATGWYEARMMAAFVDEPARVTPAQMDRWCRDFDSWAICDTVCFHLFDRTSHAWGKIDPWARRKEEFVRRGGYALLACLAVHDKQAEDESFGPYLPLIERGANDGRNFVKKGVSWALRGIGRRSSGLHAAAVALAKRLGESSEPAARWVGKDALRDLNKPAVIRRFRRSQRVQSVCRPSLTRRVSAILTRRGSESRRQISAILTRRASESRRRVSAILTRRVSEGRRQVSAILTRRVSGGRRQVSAILTRRVSGGRRNWRTKGELMLHILFAPLLLAAPPKAELVQSYKIWDSAGHNAFTDLVRFNDTWFCVFREGTAHVSPDGAVRVITSTDGKTWESAALLTSKTMDLRDPKIVVTPKKELMIVAAGALIDRSRQSHQSLAWFSNDGKKWGDAIPVGDADFWLWRVTWHDSAALGIGYPTTKANKGIRVYRSDDGRTWETILANAFDKSGPNETGTVIDADGTAITLLRRDDAPATAQLGTSKPPYQDWTWRDLGVRVGGPAMIRVPEVGLIAVVRLYDKPVRTAVCAVDEKAAKLTELLSLPSGGDTSYAGLFWHDGILWVSYYASHEGKTSIYLAKVKLTP